MATGNHLKNCFEDATCSLCQEYFKDPVAVDCGHNFCQACITQYLEKTEAEPSCPQCRETISQVNLSPNRQLANLVELVKKLQLEMQEGEKRGVCGKHQEPLRFFCKEDQMCICLVCDKSREHKDHNVLPLEEASQEYKGQIKNKISSLVNRKRKLKALHSDKVWRTQTFLTLLEKERQKGISAFERMQTALEESKRSWLYCLDDLGKKMEENCVENSAELLNQITDFSFLIAKLEEKCQQPAGEFLQDIVINLNRCKLAEKRSMMFKPSQKLESTLTMFTHKREAFEKIFKECQDSLEKALQKVCVTLDHDTAHCCLSVSEDQRSVKGGRKFQSHSSRPEQFDIMPCVLGCEKFTAGRHYWDVEVEGDEGSWVIGVARESIKRKGNISFSPEKGIWAIQYPFGFILKFKTLMAPLQILKGSLEPLSKIRVSLDYEAGRVTFSDACTGTSIFTFSSACFAGERVCPFFLVSQGTALNCC